MITMISPAKNMKPERASEAPLTLPIFMEDAKGLIQVLRTYSPWDIQGLMDVSERLAKDCFDRIFTWKSDKAGTPALETFDGLQYKYMDPWSFTEEMKTFAQEHVRILSGLYGVLKPYDSIYEYRLEMAHRLSADGCENLYDYWGDRIYRELMSTGADTIINLASAEYGKAVKKYAVRECRYITCTFMTPHRGRNRVLATAAKMARGRMVRFISEYGIDIPDGVKDFHEDGYRFEPSLSTEMEFVFLKSF